MEPRLLGIALPAGEDAGPCLIQFGGEVAFLLLGLSPVAPFVGAAEAEPVLRGADIGHHVHRIRHQQRLFSAGGQENADRLMLVPDRALVERALDLGVAMILAGGDGGVELGMLVAQR